MLVLIDKIILLLCCFLFYIFQSLQTANVVYLLEAITFSCLISYFESKKFSYVFIVTYLIICLFYPDLCFFIPLIVYDLYMFRHISLSILSLLIFINFVTLSSPFIVIFIILLCFISLLLQYKSEHIFQLERDFKKLRDTSTEYNLLLRSKNKNLMEKQDYEINLATLSERNRIAREIHDNVGHVLSRSLLQLGAIMAINKEPNISQHLSGLKSTLSNAMDSIRDSVHDLHDDSIDLYSTVQGLLHDYQNYIINFDFDMGEDIPKNIKYCYISITKEALSNISKHSNATRFDIIFREHPGLYQLVIVDNGTDIVVNSNGIGLENMNDRITNLGGSFQINTKDGFKIFASVPKKKQDT